MRRIINTYWADNSRGTLGVVLAEDEFKQIAYISACGGKSIREDEITILEHGTKLTEAQAIGFFGDQVNKLTYKR
jgi:hypothetical protein